MTGMAMLFVILALLAALPSASVALVVTRSTALGLANGLAVAAGIVLGDLVFAALALLGLSVLAQTMGGLFAAVRVLGALYLIWLGFRLMTAGETTSFVQPEGGDGRRHLAVGLLSGFVLTLGDIKAIVFYASLFPMFVDLATPKTADMLMIGLITAASVGGVKAGYALLANRLVSVIRRRGAGKGVKKAAGGLLVGAGSCLIIKS